MDRLCHSDAGDKFGYETCWRRGWLGRAKICRGAPVWHRQSGGLDAQALIDDVTAWDGKKAFDLMSLSLPKVGEAESAEHK